MNHVKKDTVARTLCHGAASIAWIAALFFVVSDQYGHEDPRYALLGAMIGLSSAWHAGMAGRGMARMNRDEGER